MILFGHYNMYMHMSRLGTPAAVAPHRHAGTHTTSTVLSQGTSLPGCGCCAACLPGYPSGDRVVCRIQYREAPPREMISRIHVGFVCWRGKRSF